MREPSDKSSTIRQSREEDNEELSEYDVSMFSASQLFERVNLPSIISQYDKDEEDHVNLKPVSDASSELVSDINDFEGT